MIDKKEIYSAKEKSNKNKKLKKHREKNHISQENKEKVTTKNTKSTLKENREKETKKKEKSLLKENNFKKIIETENITQKENIEKMTKENEITERKNIRVYSYNSRGFDLIKQKYCNEILNIDTDSVPILCNQENFVLKGNRHIVQNALPGFHAFIKPATKEQMEGRPANGMFIAVPEQLRNRCKDISPNHSRIQSLLLKTTETTIMIINAYFPLDPKKESYDYDPDLEDVLATIENLVDAHQCNCVVVVGDLNCDYRRQNGRVGRLKDFLSSNSMETAWETFQVDYTHEFEKEGISYISTLDHILWNQNLKSSVTRCGVIHSINNTSDHSPIFCDINEKITSEIIKDDAKAEGKGVRTHDLNDEEWMIFHNDLEARLAGIRRPKCVDCRDPNCVEEGHRQQINSYTEEVLRAIDTSITCIAGSKRSNRKNAKIIPGWNDIVQPMHDDAVFWNAVWKSAGKPLNTTLHTIMKKTRNAYHYAIRKCKRASEHLKKDKLLQSCVTGKNNIFDEIRRMRKTTDRSPCKIDGNENPVERFGEVYETLFNSAGDQAAMNKILSDINSKMGVNDLEEVDRITPEIISEAVDNIKVRKDDPVFSFNSNCIKQAPKSLYYHIAEMIKCFLLHGYVSDILLVATIIPLVKNKLGDLESSDNYRSIALSSVILKIYDWVVLILCGDKLGLDELQFSYQKNCSTTMCTWMVVETVSYFTRNGSNVYSCFMDMKKAFDTVKHGILFKKLMERNLPLIHVRLLIVMYLNQTAKVKWKGYTSATFPIVNGVKQGAVISAILFCVYINDLIKVLRRKKDGCWINENYVGIIVYADDIALLSPSLDGLQNMINSCLSYAKDHNLSFSTNDDPSKSKTKCMAFQRRKQEIRKLDLNGTDLPWVNTLKHLGSTLTNDIGRIMEQDLVEKRAMYISRNNELSQEFFFAHHKTKIWINNMYNTSFYSSPLWDFSSKHFTRLENSWNVSQRMMMNLPRKTHRFFIEPLTKTQHIRKSLRKRFVNFICKVKDSSKAILRHLLYEIRSDCRSTTGNNIRKILLEYGATKLTDINIKNAAYKEIPEGEEWKIPLVSEIVETLAGNLDVAHFTNDQLKEICDEACVN